MRYGSIYAITNKSTGKKYIGQTIFSVEVRWNVHKTRYFHNSYISKAIHKYGEDSFIFEELCSSFDKDSLNDAEKYFVSYYNTMSPNGYNQTSGGDSKTIFTKEVRLKMRNAKLGKKRVNQSGSTKSKKLEHAQRLESEPTSVEYNLSTSPRFPGKYVSNKEKIIKLYEETNSTYKVAKELNLDKSHVGRWLKTWGYLRNQSKAASRRNKNRYSLKRDKYKDIIISSLIAGKSLMDLSRQLNISYSTLQKWKYRWNEEIQEKKIV